MYREGKVVAVRRGRVEVCFDPDDRCAACQGCAGGKKPQTVSLRGAACEGDRVTVSFPEKGMLLSALLGYGLPLAGLIAGLALGAALTDAEWQWALYALAGTALLTLPARLLDRRENPWFPRIISIEKKENVS